MTDKVRNKGDSFPGGRRLALLASLVLLLLLYLWLELAWSRRLWFLFFCLAIYVLFRHVLITH